MSLSRVDQADLMLMDNKGETTKHGAWHCGQCGHLNEAKEDFCFDCGEEWHPLAELEAALTAFDG